MFDLAALIDRSRLAHLPPRAQQALGAFLDATAQALRERRFGAVVIDEADAHAFGVEFAQGLAGVDGVPGTPDDPYARGPGRVLSEPTAIALLLGYPVHSPYVRLPTPR